MAFETLSSGMLDSFRQPVFLTPEQAELQEAERLRQAAVRIDERLTSKIAKETRPYYDHDHYPARPLAETTSWDVERFASTHLEDKHVHNSCFMVRQRIYQRMADEPHLMVRAITDVKENGGFAYGYGMHTQIADDRGVLNLTLQKDGFMTLRHTLPDGGYDRFFYSVVELGGKVVMRRDRDIIDVAEAVPIGRDTLEQRGRRMQEVLENNQRFTGEGVHLVGPEEASFLNDLIAASSARECSHDRGELRFVCYRRRNTTERPSPIGAAWAAREAEQVATEFLQYYGGKPVERMFVDHTVTTSVVPPGSMPASLSARTTRVVPADYVRERTEGHAAPGNYQLVTESMLTVVGNKLEMKDSETIVSDDGERTC